MSRNPSFRASLRRAMRDAALFREFGVAYWDDLLTLAARDTAEGIAVLADGLDDVAKAWFAAAAAKVLMHKTFGEDWIARPPAALEVLPA